MRIAFMLFDGFTALDAVGPYEVLSRVPGADVCWVAERAGNVASDPPTFTMVADHAFGDVSEADVLVVPGGFGTRSLVEHWPTLDRIRAIDATTTWTTSVCTGSLLLAAAGLLDAVDATTHWGAMELLGKLGARPTAERVVERGKIVTAAGVSAGIDMALHLVDRMLGPAAAQAIQLSIEYDPQPPFDAGSVEKAPPQVLSGVRTAITRRQAEGTS